MPISDDSRNQVRVLILVFIAFNIALIASARLLPFIDLPNHLAEATIYKFYEPGDLLATYYRPTPWYFPNTFHTVFCSIFPSVETGNKVFHILCIILLQGGIFLVIKQLDGNAWYGVLAIPFTYNYNVSFGFVGFAISIPFLIILFYAILRYVEKERLYLNFIIAFLLGMLFFMHAQNALMGLIIYGCMLSYHYRADLWRLFYHAVLVPLPLVIMILTWWFTREAEQQEESTLGYLSDYYTSKYFQTFFLRFRIVVFDNFQLHEGLTGLIIAAFFFSCVVVPLISIRSWKKKLPSLSSTPGLVYAGILLIIVFACYLFAPDKLPGQTPIFQRFCTIVILSFIIFSSVLLKDVRSSWLKYLALVAVCLYSALWAEYIYTFNRQNKDFTAELFADMEPARKLAGLIYDSEYRGRKVYIHFPNYYIVWKQGIAASKMIDYRFGVVRRAASAADLPFYEELIGDHYGHQPQYSKIDYLLVRGSAPVAKDINLENFSLWRSSGSWKIFINNQQ